MLFSYSWFVTATVLESVVFHNAFYATSVKFIRLDFLPDDQGQNRYGREDDRRVADEPVRLHFRIRLHLRIR